MYREGSAAETGGAKDKIQVWKYILKKEIAVASFRRLHVLNAMYDTGVVPLFYNSDVSKSKEVIKACYAGGAKVIEFYNRGDRAWSVFTSLLSFVEQEMPGVILGIGSVIDASMAMMYISSGANFVVSPVLVPEIARVCNRHKVAYLPGCGTVSEIFQAEELGCEIVKVFPANCLGGADFIKAIKGPMPWTSIMPTGGVRATRESVTEWVKAGAACLGMGGDLIRQDLVTAGDYKTIRKNVENVLAWFQEASG
jgi:2-dehydro-3-deoxyphosphogluconate aldolase/(4S)-4-hydroxy-2-oxoglutarate aldolase